MKKAQGMSINTIIIAAIALIVMTLIVMIVTGGLGDLGKRSNSCRGNGGVCYDIREFEAECGDDEFEQPRYDLKCYEPEGEEEKYCCMKI